MTAVCVNARPDSINFSLVRATAAGWLRRAALWVVLPDLNLGLEPLKFMEFSLQGTTQGCVIGRAGACVVNLPAPERYAVHKLIVYGERPVAERAKAAKDILQATVLAEYFAQSGQARAFNQAWRDALGRGPGWRRRALQGQKALLRLAPELGIPALWKH
ncbi:MAG: hypothetical protein EPO19_04240 [Betaproteobacteria bacterium]|nr:MAG: hypothetical protein EPO19_04240 [Betaproteobacteria bacterium]